MVEIHGIQILNTVNEDHHAHTANFSDGFNTVDEMVIQAGKIGMKKLVLTDHSQAALDATGIGRGTARSIIRRWKNVHNDVEVLFGVEGDILNLDGDICADIQGIQTDHLILSAHSEVFSGDKTRITEAYLRAIERHSSKVLFLGHLCSIYFEKEIDVDPIIELALQKDMAFEFNCGNLVNNKTNMVNLRRLLSRAKKLYVNSDAHTLSELTLNREEGFRFLHNYSW